MKLPIPKTFLESLNKHQKMREYIDHVKMFQNGLLQTKASTAKVSRIQHEKVYQSCFTHFLYSLQPIKYSLDGTKFTIIKDGKNDGDRSGFFHSKGGCSS